MNPGAETYQITLNREDLGTSWGFRLQGGTDFAQPLSVGLVNNGSIADRYGLRAGDAVLRINDTNSSDLSHEQAKYEILRSGNSLHLLVTRGAVTIWKPSVTQLELGNIRPAGGPHLSATHGYNDEPVIQKTSLAANKQEFLNIGASHNRSARPFLGGGGDLSPQPSSCGRSSPYGQQGGQYGAPPVIGCGAPPQYGAPAPQGYGVAMQYEAPPSGSLGQPANSMTPETNASPPPDSYPVLHEDLHADPSISAQQSPAFRQVEDELFRPSSQMGGFRSVQAPKDKPPSERKQAEYMTCKACGGLCVGVFVRIKGNPLHPECFKCVACGKNLKNEGHFEVEGQLYCDVHAAQAAQPPEPGMVATPVYR